MKLRNIDELIQDRGEVTLGRVGPIPCAAIATEGQQPLAMLVRRRRESLAALLERLDEAIGRAWDDEEFVDEING